MRSAIELGHNLGCSVVAEGLETAAALDRVASLGCDTGQGFHIARPLDAQTITSWLEDRGSTSTSITSDQWSPTGQCAKRHGPSRSDVTETPGNPERRELMAVAAAHDDPAAEALAAMPQHRRLQQHGRRSDGDHDALLDAHLRLSMKK